jgi:hypothetical protein
MRFLQHRVRLNAGGEDPFVIRVAFYQVTIDAVYAGLGDLRSAGVIKEDGGALQAGELLTNGIEIQ